MKLYIMQFAQVSYYFQPLKKSEDWTALFPNIVYSLLTLSQTKYHTHCYKNNTHTHVYISTVILPENRKEKYHYEAIVSITPN